MADLYDLLEVERTATHEQIRAAFRKRAKVHHPDVGGNAELFKEIQRAHDILTDEDRRARYDRTGDLSEKVPEGNADAQMYAFIVQLMTNAMNTMADIKSSDLKNTMAQMLSQERIGVQNQMAQGEAIKDKLETAQKRFKIKPGNENKLFQMLQGQIDNNELKLIQCRGNIGIMDRVEKLLDQYDYDVDPSPVQSSYHHRQGIRGSLRGFID